MKRVKIRIDTGCVCEPYGYEIPGMASGPGRPRFGSEEKRAEHRCRMAWRDHMRKVNGDYRHEDLYATLIFADDYPHTEQEKRRLLDNYRRRLLRSCPDGEVGVIRKGNRVRMTVNGVPGWMLQQKWSYRPVLVEPLIGFEKSSLRVTYGGKLAKRLERNK